MGIRRILSLACLGFAGLTSTSAVAGPLGYFQFSNLQATVTDLAPDDGVNAAISFEPFRHYAAVARATDGSSHVLKSYWGSAPGAVSVNTGEGMAGGRADGSVFRSEVAPVEGEWHSWYDIFADFTLTPNSRVTFSFDWEMLSVLPLRSTDPEVAVRNWGVLSFLSEDRQRFALQSVPSYERNGHSSGKLALTIEAGAQGEAGMFSAAADSLGYEFAAPAPSDVPEPASYGLMLAGLAALAAMRRRRRQ